MNKIWITRQESQNCILFFNGWGMDENAVSHLDAGDFDICMLNDYNPILPLDERLDEFSAVYVVAWSLGVWAAAKLLDNSGLTISKAIALNGTQRPIDVNYGIPPLMFNATLDTWSMDNREKFNIRMSGGRKQYGRVTNCIPARDVDNQKRELSNLKREISMNKSAEMPFDCALIGTNDQIFTPANQENYWNSRARIINKDVPHFPFTIFDKWEQIIAL